MKPYVGWKTWQPIRAEKKSRLSKLPIATHGAAVRARSASSLL